MQESFNAGDVSLESPATGKNLSLRWLLLFGLVIAFAFQGSRGLWSPDEGRYVGVALQMISSGNYLAPGFSPTQLNFSKPPLTYWTIAASLQVFGHNTWAARGPYALAFVLTLWVLYAMGKRLQPAKPWLPALVYGCSVFPFLTSNVISTDVLLTLIEGFGVLGFVQARHSTGEAERRRGLTLMWLGFGLAFLTKGPPGLLPLLAILIYAALFPGWPRVRELFTLSGLALFAVIGLTWYVLVVLRYPWLLHYFLHQEVYDRIFTAVHRRHPGAFGWAIVFLPVLIVGTFPWWLGMLRVARSVASRANWRAWRGQNAPEPFLAMWFIVPFIVFCLAQSRLPMYILPLFLPLSLLIARQMERSVDLGSTRCRVLLIAWVLVLVSAKAVAAYAFHSQADNRLAARELAAQAAVDSYEAVVFLENTSDVYSLEERTPWGLRLYLNRTVYAIAWSTPEASNDLCAALKARRPTLLVVDAEISAPAVANVLTHCGVASATPAGSWRGRSLLKTAG
ncbi:glycosyltransferase family 39 protein [Dyella solisilvae]|uniref:Glycosyltransferase family 39 protein n=1 Tax=Dyella solisilvae TaxID=1920168 RepID=A0A370K499_9GAMM|nr:glycosyltransferase family 39 protein [Dyella solisilvae]RDI97486.1 glycosyltransferase family 39 protein [Dyella solisilvae]